MENITNTITPRKLNYSLEDYWKAPSGHGPLASIWKDKPTRLYYDLIAAILYLENITNNPK